jgi:hypothetical protein
MNMKWLLTLGRLTVAVWLCVLTLTGGAGAATVEESNIEATIKRLERAVLETYKTNDKKTYLLLSLPSFYEITSDGTINTLQDQLNELDDYVLGDYRMDEVVVTVVSSTLALIRYRIAAQWTYKGKELPVDTMLASAVWVRTDGTWKAATYQEVKLPAHR